MEENRILSALLDCSAGIQSNYDYTTLVSNSVKTIGKNALKAAGKASRGARFASFLAIASLYGVGYLIYANHKKSREIKDLDDRISSLERKIWEPVELEPEE